jgi:hypothetical protein
MDNEHYNKLAHSMSANKEELEFILKDITSVFRYSKKCEKNTLY